MACPHITGLTAYLAALEGITTSADMTARIRQLAATTGAAVGGQTRGTTTLIAYNGDGF